MGATFYTAPPTKALAAFSHFVGINGGLSVVRRLQKRQKPSGKLQADTEVPECA